MKLELSRQVVPKNSIPNFIKILPMGAELFHAGGRAGVRTERPYRQGEAKVVFRDFANAFKEEQMLKNSSDMCTFPNLSKKYLKNNTSRRTYTRCHRFGDLSQKIILQDD